MQFVQCLYLTETHVGVDLEGAYRRAAAGPLDALLPSVLDKIFEGVLLGRVH